MVSVVVTRAFTYLGRNVFPDDVVDMEPLDAAVHSHAGHVSLLHGNQYLTRHMVASEPEVCAPVVFPASLSITEPPAEKRRRGRPRKVKG